jgi:hypothetical protein
MRQKLQIIGVAAFAAIATNASAIDLGLTIGSSFNTVSADPSDADFKYKSGFLIGADLSFASEQGFLTNIGVQLAKKGFKTDYYETDLGDGAVSIYEDFGATYINIPIRGGYRTNLGPKAQLQLLFGPYIGIKLSESYKIRDAAGDSISIPNLSLAKTMVFGVDFETRFLFSITEIEKLGLSLAYSFSVLNVANSGEVEDKLGVEDYQAKYRGFSVAAHYQKSF